MIRKLKQISLLLLSLGVAMSAGAQIQGFESSGSTWKFTPKPAAYNDINNTDIWDDTTGVGYNGSGLSQITAKSGTYCWVARDIDNPIAIGWHYLDFDTINISSFNSNLLEFYYYSVGFDATDSIAYIVQYDNSATWNFGDKVMLNKNTGQWTQVQVNIPSGKTYVRLRLMVKQNGNDDWAAFDDVSLSSSNTDNIKPTVINSWIENANTVKIAYSEAMNSFVDSSKYYSGLTSISSVVSKMSGGLDTATITLSSGLLPGKFYELQIDSNIMDLAGNRMEKVYRNMLYFNNTMPELAITEIMYNSPSSDPDSLDFVEIRNNGNTVAALGGLTFHNGGITIFPELYLNSGEFVLLGMDSAACRKFYGKKFYQFNDALSNGGEALVIRNTAGVTIDSVSYDDASPWPLGPPSPDGGGTSLEIIDYNKSNLDAANWKVATNLVKKWNGTVDVFASPSSSVPPTTPTVEFEKAEFIGSENLKKASVNINIANENSNQVEFKVSWVNGFATASLSDVTWADTMVVVNAGFNGLLTFEVPVVDDNLNEASEYFALRISQLQNATAGSKSTTTVFVHDNDLKTPKARKNISLEYIGGFDVPGTAGSAEISAYDYTTKRLFVANSLENKIHIVDVKNPDMPVQTSEISLSTFGSLTSVASSKGLVAVASPSNQTSANGSVIILDVDGNVLKQVEVGVQPDMVTFSPDGKWILIANEGQPETDYSQDGEGSISMIDISGGISTVNQSKVTTVGFTAFNNQKTELLNSGVRLFGVNSTVSQDLEPEYISVNTNGKIAYITLQENNAIAVLDIAQKKITEIRPLGVKDMMTVSGAMDVSDQGTEIKIAQWPVKAMFIPDAISSFNANGIEYYITANEGDYREYDALEEEVRVGALKLDSAKFPEQSLLKNSGNLGRLSVTNTLGDTDNDGDYDELYTLGSRSFSIWNASNGQLVKDCGSEMERIIAADSVFGKIFNASNSGASLKNRSDNKGPEPEGVTTALINDTLYAFVVLERIGGVMVYDISNPSNPIFVDYANNRSGATGDLGAEGILFIPADKSPNGKHLLAVSNEVSGTVAFYEVQTDYTNSLVNFEMPSIEITEGDPTAYTNLVIRPKAKFNSQLILKVNYVNASSGDITMSPTIISDSIVVNVQAGTTYIPLAFSPAFDVEVENKESLTLTIHKTGFGLAPGTNKTFTISILDNDFTGIVEQDASLIQCYPVPASSKLNFSEKINSLQILTTDGKLLKSAIDVTDINVDDLPEGIYLIKLNLNQTIRIQIAR